VTTDPIQRFIDERAGMPGRRTILSRMTPAESVDSAVKMYQALGWAFLSRTALPTLFCLASLLFCWHFLGTVFETHQSTNLGELKELAAKLGVTLCIGAPLFMIAVGQLVAVVTCLSSDYALGRVPDGKAASARAQAILPRLTAACTRELFACFGGFIFAVALLWISQLIPAENALSGYVVVVGIVGLVAGVLVGVYAFIVHAVVPPVVIIEGLGAAAAAKRSRLLLSIQDPYTRSSGAIALLRLGFLCLLISGSVYIAWGFVDSIADVSGYIHKFLPGTFAHGLLETAWKLWPTFLWLWLTLPLWAAGATLIYYECRVRTEGFDIDVLASDVWRQDKKVRFEI
jgi:hypothetical protein